MTGSSSSGDVHADLDLSPTITRRDFVNGALVGAGASLLASCGRNGAASTDPLAPSGSAWTGYGGVGDYAWSNGNTEAVRDAAHGIRDGLYKALASQTVDETYDVVIVGGGFSGLTAAFEFRKNAKPNQRCLLIENHPVPGGEAKQNDFEVDGRRLTGPQGSNEALVPVMDYGDRYKAFSGYWHELGLPTDFAMRPLAGGAEKYRIPNSHYEPMVLEDDYRVGYFFGAEGWRIRPWERAFSDTPWPASLQKEIDEYYHNRRDIVSTMGKQDDVGRFLDSMTYRQLLDRLGYGPEVSRLTDPLIGVGNHGVCGDAISAYAAYRLALPGTIPSNSKGRFAGIKSVSFPGGNAAVYRNMLKRIVPEAIDGDGKFRDNLLAPFDFTALDRPGQPVRIRLGATAVRVEHDGPPQGAERVLITYAKQGALRRIAAKSVVVASGGWVNRRIVKDLPDDIANAYAGFHYGPVLTANVALRHWRFFDKLGFVVARWFEGLGWHACVRRDVDISGTREPFTPDSPTVLTLYIPFLHPGEDGAVQGALGRQTLMDTPYADFERQIREQLTLLFGTAGFDARRDIAGIVLNRWGHAFFAPSPGFFFGRDGALPPHEIVRKGYGRIQFANSELQGNMNMAHAMLEGGRGGRAAMDLL